ncbi:MAG: 4Fe-4S dicluster domain-containing protein [Coriobacteriia bacterium]
MESNRTTFSRKTFLEVTGAAAATLGLGGVARVLKRGHSPLRPPGGQDEVSFISRCLKCDRCRSVCPTSVIGVAHLEDGIIDARTPKLNFKLGYCTFCGKCVEVCPTEALVPFETETTTFGSESVNKPVSLVVGLAVVRKDRCLAWLAPTPGCTQCSQQCPYDAISLDKIKRPIVDESKCNGCGLCEYVCPALQLRSYIGGTIRGIEVEPISRGGEVQ